MVQTDKVGVNAVEAIFLKDFDWLFREQSISDSGVDAHVEVKANGRPIGRLLALQIKSGKSYFKHEKKDHYVHYGKRKHLWYWQNNSLPVVLVLHNPETGKTLWERINPSKSRFTRRVGRSKSRKQTWSIRAPSRNLSWAWWMLPSSGSSFSRPTIHR